MRRAVSAASLAVVLLLGGCGDATQHASTAEDFTRAAAIWVDPWVGGTTRSAPTGTSEGPRGSVKRLAAGSERLHVGVPVDDATRVELDGAGAAGWSVIGSTCADDRVVVALGRDGARAELEVDDAEAGSIATITAVVPHHTERPWSAPDAAVTTVCRSGSDLSADRPTREALDLLGIGRLPRDAADESDGDVADRPSEAPAAQTALLDRAWTDPWLARAVDATAVTVAHDEVGATASRAALPSSAGRRGRGWFREVRIARAGGWTPTYLACAGGRLLGAQLVHPDLPGVVATITPNRTTPTLPLQVTVDAGLPGDPPVPAATAPPSSTACLTATGSALVTDGRPYARPTVVGPWRK